MKSHPLELEKDSLVQIKGSNEYFTVSNLWPMDCMWLSMAMNVAQHKSVNLLKTL